VYNILQAGDLQVGWVCIKKPLCPAMVELALENKHGVLVTRLPDDSSVLACRYQLLSSYSSLNLHVRPVGCWEFENSRMPLMRRYTSSFVLTVSLQSEQQDFASSRGSSSPAAAAAAAACSDQPARLAA
jgi:hypothetical protein